LWNKLQTQFFATKNVRKSEKKLFFVKTYWFNMLYIILLLHKKFGQTKMRPNFRWFCLESTERDCTFYRRCFFGILFYCPCLWSKNCAPNKTEDLQISCDSRIYHKKFADLQFAGWHN
jgi:hypothetical protein